MRRVTDQRGAVAVVVALLMVSLVGFAALAVDVGAVWLDRKELQNGADAAALALAQSCAEGACAADEYAMANSYATGNKRDANVNVAGITHGASSVTVDVTTTRDHWFAPVLGADSSDVPASATATWGGIGSAWVSPFTVSVCHLAEIENGTPDVKLVLKDPLNDCVAGNPPHALPGGMNWLDTFDSADCTVETDIDGWAVGDPGADGTTNSNCDDLLKNLVGKELLIPIFDDVAGTGAGAYHIAGFAVFQVDAYCLNKGAGWWGNTTKCTAKQRWVQGTFVERVHLGAEGGGPDYGATTAYLTD